MVKKKSVKKKVAKKKVAKKQPRTTPTPKETRFIEEYLIDQNGTQAAIRAKFSEKSARTIACDLLIKPYIKELIKAAVEKQTIRTQITADKVLLTIQNTIDRCNQVSPVIDSRGEAVLCETPNGDMVPAFTFDPKAVLKGCELLGKHLKLFTEKVELSGAIKYPDLTDDELNRKIMSLESLKEQGLRD